MKSRAEGGRAEGFRQRACCSAAKHCRQLEVNLDSGCQLNLSASTRAQLYYSTSSSSVGWCNWSGEGSDGQMSLEKLKLLELSFQIAVRASQATAAKSWQ